MPRKMKTVNWRDVLVVIGCGIVGLIILTASGADKERRAEQPERVTATIEGCSFSRLWSDECQGVLSNLRQVGLLGQHELHRFKISPILRGDFSGSFYFGLLSGAGNVRGRVTNEDAIRFAWSPHPGQIIMSVVPVSMIKIIVDETMGVPTIEFLINGNAFWDLLVLDNYSYRGQGNEREMNPNTWISSNCLTRAVVRINSKDLESEVYLPTYK